MIVLIVVLLTSNAVRVRDIVSDSDTGLGV